MTMNLIVKLKCGKCVWCSPSTLLFDHQGAKGHTDIAHLSPILAPRIANPPIVSFFFVTAPTDHGNHMISVVAFLGDDSRLEIQEWIRIDAARDGAACKDFLLHG